MQGITPTSFTDRRVFSPVPHAVIHVPRITTSLLFKNFFLAAQFASWSGTADPVSLAVHLIGGESVVLPTVGTLDREELVKEVGRGRGGGGEGSESARGVGGTKKVEAFTIS